MSSKKLDIKDNKNDKYNRLRKELRCSACPPNKGENKKSYKKHGTKKPKYKNHG
jgi:hypothetical protein